MNLAALRTIAAQASNLLISPEQVEKRLNRERYSRRRREQAERAHRNRLRREEYEAAHYADMLEECAAWGIPQTALGVYLLEHFFPARLPNGRLVWLNFCAPKNRYPFDVCLTASIK